MPRGKSLFFQAISEIAGKADSRPLSQGEGFPDKRQKAKQIPIRSTISGIPHSRPEGLSFHFFKVPIRSTIEEEGKADTELGALGRKAFPFLSFFKVPIGP